LEADIREFKLSKATIELIIEDVKNYFYPESPDFISSGDAFPHLLVPLPDGSVLLGLNEDSIVAQISPEEIQKNAPRAITNQVEYIRVNGRCYQRVSGRNHWVEIPCS